MISDAGESPEWGAAERCQGDALDRDKKKTKGPTNRLGDACTSSCVGSCWSRSRIVGA